MGTPYSECWEPLQPIFTQSLPTPYQTTNTEVNFDSMLNCGSSRCFPDVLHFSDPAPEPLALVVDETIHHGDLISAGDPASDLEMSHEVYDNGSPQKPGD